MSYTSLKKPFSFDKKFEHLNSLFKEVENYDILSYSEEVTISTTHCLNVIGAISTYLQEKNRTKNIERRYEMMTEALYRGLYEKKKRIDEITKNELKKIDEEFKLKVHKMDNNLETLRKGLRLRREKQNKRNELQKNDEKLKKEVRDGINKSMIIIKRLIDSFGSNIDFMDEEISKHYNSLCDAYEDSLKNYNELIKKEIIGG